jgi:hypothetical protein
LGDGAAVVANYASTARSPASSREGKRKGRMASSALKREGGVLQASPAPAEAATQTPTCLHPRKQCERVLASYLLPVLRLIPTETALFIALYLLIPVPNMISTLKQNCSLYRGLQLWLNDHHQKITGLGDS